MSKATDVIDYVSKKARIQETVTSNFVTSTIELPQKAVEKLEAKTEQAGDTPSLRFIKPSRDFYNKLVGVWLKFDSSTLEKLSPSDFVQTSRTQLGSIWSENLIKPTESFFKAAKQEWANLTSQNVPGEWSAPSSSISIVSFFDRLKTTLLDRWNAEIVAKSSDFQKIDTNFKSS